MGHCLKRDEICAHWWRVRDVHAHMAQSDAIGNPHKHSARATHKNMRLRSNKQVGDLAILLAPLEASPCILLTSLLSLQKSFVACSTM